MADSSLASSVVLRNEDQSGKGKITRDKGGLTRWGISSRAYPKEDVQNMTPERAKFLFVRDYWNPLKLDGIKSQEVALSIFDFAVNSGVSRSRMTLRLTTGSKRVGAMTSKDIDEINSIDPRKFIVAFGLMRKGFYERIAKSDPSQALNLKGWISRAESFYKNITTRQLVLVSVPVAAILIVITHKAGKKWLMKKKAESKK